MIQDPAGLLERLPELEPLCQDARVRAAVEAGDPFKVYRVLRWARLTGRLNKHRETVKALLARRRPFAKPFKRSPYLGTYNGFGATLLGSSEADPQDDTRIAVHSLVMMFVIPVMPMGAYLVRQGKSTAMSSSWEIFARVPLSLSAWLFRGTVAVGLVLGLALTSVGAMYGSRFGDVHLLNGFDVPVQVQLGEFQGEVPPHSFRVVNLPLGTYPGRATVGEVLVEELRFEVAPKQDFRAWNLAGAAPLFFDSASYTLKPAPEDRAEPLKVFCGQSVVRLDKVDHVMAPPPSTVKIPKGLDEVRRTFVRLDPEATEPREVCLGFLSMKDRMAETLPFLVAQAKITGWAEEDALRVAQVAYLGRDPQAVALTRTARDAHPDSVTLHRYYQEAVRQTGGELGPLQQEYRALAEAQPHRADLQYLQLRLSSGPSFARHSSELVERFPKDPDLLRARLIALHHELRWPEVLEVWARLEEVDPQVAAESIESAVDALVALRRPTEALALLTERFPRHPDEQWNLAMLYARVAGHAPTSRPEQLIEKLETDGEKVWALRALAGLQVEGAPKTPLLRLAGYLRTDPAKAVASASGVSSAEYFKLGPAPWALVYGEAVRTGVQPAAEAMRKVPYLNPSETALFEALVRGERADLAKDELDDAIYAAGCVIRARNPQLTEQERKSLLTDARARAPLLMTHPDAVSAWLP